MISLKASLFSSRGMAPVLVLLRPSNEHILIVRVPGAKDRHGCHPFLFIVGALRARRMVVCSLTLYGVGGVGGAGSDSFLAQFVAVTQSPTSWAGAGTLRTVTGAPPCGLSVQTRMA